MRVLGPQAADVASRPQAVAAAQALRERLLLLRDLRGPAVADFTHRVRRLVVVSSSSRGGSSMLAELLRHSGSLLHLRAEFNPFLRLVGLGFPESGSGCDALDERHVRDLDPRARQVLDHELAMDAGVPSELVDDDERFVLDAAWRFAIQWPGVNFDVATWVRTARQVLELTRRKYRWAAGELRDPARFQLELLNRLGGFEPDLSPWYYDLPEALLRGHPPAPRGAPGDVVVEEPPFVLSQAWRRAEDRDVAHKALVIKTPSNAYRMGFLRALFPNARVQVLHLTRNPAASVNGLFDGWRHRCFHSHRMAAPLGIRGYADAFPAERRWWKFDLPPGWTDYTNAPLLDVCAYQWRSAHRAILADAAGSGADYLRIRFEDLTRDPQARVRAVGRLADWLGIPLDGPFHRVVRDGIDPVVPTAPPGPRRWLSRAEAIDRALDADARALAEELGYGGGADDTWI